MSDPRRQRDEARFDEELDRIAGEMASEPLPPGIFDVVRPGHSSGFDGVRTRQAMPGLAAAAAAVLVLVLATTAVVAPGFLTPPTASRPPVEQTFAPKPAPEALRLPGAIRSDLEALEWTCRTGEKLASIAPGEHAVVQESAICAGPDEGPYTALATVETSKVNQVVRVTVKADIVGEDTDAARAAVALALGEAASHSIVNYGNQVVTKYWIYYRLPLLSPGATHRLDLNGFTGLLDRLAPSGTYVLKIELQVPDA